MTTSGPGQEGRSTPGRHDTVVTADVEIIGYRKEKAQVRDHVIFSDESVRTGGEGTAPSPLQYFVSSIVFWEETHIGQFAHAMKVELTSVKAHVEGHFWRTGSVLNDSVDCGCDKIVISIDVESPDDPALVAAALRNGRKGCYIRKALGIPVEDTLRVNGQPFDFNAYPHPRRSSNE